MISPENKLASLIVSYEEIHKKYMDYANFSVLSTLPCAHLHILIHPAGWMEHIDYFTKKHQEQLPSITDAQYHAYVECAFVRVVPRWNWNVDSEVESIKAGTPGFSRAGRRVLEGNAEYQ